MITPEIISFIKQQVSLGISQEQITNSLKQNGWSDQDISEAFRQNVSVVPTPTSVPVSPNVAKTNKSKNGLLWSIIIILLIVILCGLFFFLKNSNTENSNGIQTPATSTVAQTSETQASTIVSVVKGMLSASHNAGSYSDVQNVMTQYYSAEAIQKFQASLSKLSSSQLSSIQKFLVTIDQNYPDPSSLQFNIVINGDMATATASLPDSSATSTGPGGYTVTMSHNSISVILQKESGVWKVNMVDVMGEEFDDHEYSSSPNTATAVAEYIAPSNETPNETLPVGQPYIIKWKIEPENINISQLTIDINVSPIINHQSSGDTSRTIVSKLTPIQAGCPTAGEVCTYTWTPTTTSPSTQFEIVIWPNVKGEAPTGAPSSVFSIQ